MNSVVTYELRNFQAMATLRCHDIMKTCTTHNIMIPLSQAQPPLTLKWRQCRNLPCAMNRLQSVTMRQKVFVGGGGTDSHYGHCDAHTVYEYDEVSNQWVSLPPYKCRRFAMAILNDKLTLVGGLSTQTESTNQVTVLEGEGMSQKWTHPYNPMSTPRCSLAVAAYRDRLVVAGGRKSLFGGDLDTVEVLNTTSKKWLSASPLPRACSEMTSAIVNHELFLLGGTLDLVSLTVSLPNITQSTVHSATTNGSPQWHTIPAPPLEKSAAMSLCGSVLAIGGIDRNNSSTAIHVYQPAMKKWSKVGDLPCPRSSCSCTLLPSGDILVAGGLDGNRVDAATYAVTLPDS